MTDIVTARINAVADQIAAEGMILRAADVRAGAVEIARQRHEIERLRAIEQAADKAYRYHMLGYKDPADFNANVMLDLMNELGALL